MAQLGQVAVRQATSVTIRAIQGNIDVSALTSAAAIRALSQSSVRIASIISFSEASPRNTIPRYELDADTAGDIVERVPQLVDRTITINRAVLYAADMLAAFGFTSIIDIADQGVPFVIVKEEQAPANSGVQTVTTMYVGCWFHDLPKTYDMGGNLMVMQDVPIGYTKKLVA